MGPAKSAGRSRIASACHRSTAPANLFLFSQTKAAPKAQSILLLARGSCLEELARIPCVPSPIHVTSSFAHRKAIVPLAPPRARTCNRHPPPARRISRAAPLCMQHATRHSSESTGIGRSRPLARSKAKSDQPAHRISAIAPPSLHPRTCSSDTSAFI